MRRKQDPFLEIVRSLRSAGCPDEVLGLVTNAALSITRSAQATARLLDPQGQDFRVAARTGEALHRDGPALFRANEGLVGWSARCGRSTLVNDVQADARFQQRREQLWAPSGVITAPLFFGRDQVIGVLSAARRSGPGYSAEDLAKLELLAELAAPHVHIARLNEIADTDPLTGLFNRRPLTKHFEAARESALRHGRPLAMIMLDLDHFTAVNNDHGHSVGDEVLVEAARRMRQACRTPDVLFRWGGEEFLLLLPDTDARQALHVAERVLAALRDRAFATAVGAVPVTASAGACAVHPTDSLLSAVDRADARLIQAKLLGRNQARGSPRQHDERARGDHPRSDFRPSCEGA